MDSFQYRDGELHVEDLKAAALVQEHGSPLYVYSKATVLDHYGKLARAFAEFSPIICYSVKANGNLSVLRTLREAGSGFDVVSGGELYRSLRAGASPERIVYAGVGKTDRELDEALSACIRLFTVESVPELEAISNRARAMGVKARVALRVNPDVDAHTHAHITTGTAEAKFGMDRDVVEQVLSQPDHYPNAVLDGLHLHIGSQIVEVEPYAEALKRVLPLFAKYRSESVPLSHIDIGGGFGINYSGTDAKAAEEFSTVIAPLLREMNAQLVLEPGRFIVGNAGVFLCSVTYVKQTSQKRFVIVDGGMNDLIRPALYDAKHAIWPVKAESGPPSRGGSSEVPSLSLADVVGPICESGDYLGKAVSLPQMARGDLISVFSAGAYGFTMSSNYNARPRAAEILVDGAEAKVVRERETYESLIRGEE